MKIIALPSRASNRGGFTLVELLVVITIFAILATVTVSAFQGTSDADRISGTAGILKSKLEGARSRAIRDDAPRGLRLLVDGSDGRLCRSLVYVGSPEDEVGDLTALVYDSTLSAWVTTNSEDFDNDGVLDPGEDQNGNGFLDTGDWETLFANGMIVPNQSRIKIPTDGNHWYRVIGVLDASGGVPFRLVLSGHYRPSEEIPLPAPAPRMYVAEGTPPFPYRLELAPAPLPGEQPVPLPTGIAIDLDGSQLPPAWRPCPGCDPPRLEYRAGMDIMFSPRGDMVGETLVAGVMHLLIGTIDDLRNPAPTRPDGTPVTWSRPVNWGLPAPMIMVPSVFTQESRILTIFPSTGAVISAEVDVTDSYDNSTGTGSADGLADLPFSRALSGREAQ